MKKAIIFMMLIAVFLVCGCNSRTSAQREEAIKVNSQQDQYAKAQPIPAFDWSLERDLIIKLYGLRNKKVATHTVWRSDYGMIEGDCSSIGFGIPYDTSLTNPLVAEGNRCRALTSIEQPEPNGIFASKNTTATWVMSVNTETGAIEPIYVEGKVTVYPYPVKVDYKTNRVYKAGKASVNL